MAKYGDQNTVTGKAFVGKEVNTTVVALPAPVVAHADLTSKNSVLNTSELSGKQRGAVVFSYNSTDSKWYMATASGSLPESPWHLVELSVVVNPTA